MNRALLVLFLVPAFFNAVAALMRLSHAPSVPPAPPVAPEPEIKPCPHVGQWVRAEEGGWRLLCSRGGPSR